MSYKEICTLWSFENPYNSAELDRMKKACQMANTHLDTMGYSGELHVGYEEGKHKFTFVGQHLSQQDEEVLVQLLRDCIDL